MNKNYEFKPQHSQNARDFISKLMCRDIKTRPSAREALNDKWATSEEIKMNEFVAVEFLENVKSFAIGDGLKKMAYTYILSKRLYDDKNNQLLKLFEMIDTDHSGTIDEKELFDHYGKFFPGTHDEEMNQIRALIKNIDMNDSGQIEYSEFLLAADKFNKINSDNIKEIFEFFKHDNSNFIEIKDLKEMFDVNHIPAKNYEKMIDAFDKNGDKKISFSEFKEMLTLHY